MDAGPYYFRKNLIVGAILLFFAVALMILGSQLGYYQNAFQAHFSGLGTLQTSDSDADISALKNILVNILMFIPVIVLAVGGTYNIQFGKTLAYRLILLPSVAVYGISVVLDWKDATPFSETFKDIYAAIDNIIYVPFMLCFIMIVAYFISVIIKPDSVTTKVLGSITLVVSICFYVIFGVYVIYLQALSVLDDSFGMNHFILYLICFAIDVATFFLMLSLVMSFSAMNREELLWKRDMIRRRKNPSKVQEDRQFHADEASIAYDDEYVDPYDYDDDFDGYGAYMFDDDDTEDVYDVLEEQLEEKPATARNVANDVLKKGIAQAEDNPRDISKGEFVITEDSAQVPKEKPATSRNVEGAVQEEKPATSRNIESDIQEKKPITNRNVERDMPEEKPTANRRLASGASKKKPTTKNARPRSKK